MPSFYGENPPDTEVGSTDATESQISEDAVTETDTSGGFYQGSPEQTTTEAFEEDARQAKEAAEAAQEAAEAAQAAAESSETAASSSETSAAASATSATSSASSAASSATNAASSATSAASSATSAASSAADAASSASDAAASETAAATSETNAASSATNASTSASNASTSETNAASSASSAAGSATSASNSAASASTSASAAATSATNAATSESNASTSASNAASSATNSANSAAASASSATSAAGSASAAATSASNAASSETAAASSASDAASSASDAAASYDDFDDRYLGSKSSEPSTDNDGNTIQTGALFFDTTAGSMKVWTGTAWEVAYASVSGAMLRSNNLSDLDNIATARTNLGLGTAATTASTAYATAAQGLLADSAVQPGDNVSGLTNDAGYATTTYVDNEVAGLVDAAPATLDTLNELAAALGDDANFSTTVTNSIATKWTQDNTKITNWDTAYGWGNHASAGYLTSFTETDPVFSASAASGITSTNITNWNTAYGWGDHASAGYQAASTALTTSTTFGGDVSGTYNAIVIADDSHTHDGRYYTESEADSRFPVNGSGGITIGNSTASEVDIAYLSSSGSWQNGINDYYGTSSWFWYKDTGSYRGGLDASANLFIEGSVRAPIFYDKNDTNYYTDPASSSVLQGTVTINGNDNQLKINGTSGYKAAGIFFAQDGSNKWEHYYHSGLLRFYNYTQARQEMFLGDSGYVQVEYDFRAPIMYDSNSTGYYVDPASTSYLNAIDARGFYTSSNPWGTGNSAWMPNGITTPNVTSWIYGTVYLGNAPSNGSGSQADVNGIETAGWHKANVYYDRNDTNYYADPNGTSRFVALGVGYGSNASSSYPFGVKHGTRYLTYLENTANTGANYPWLVNDDWNSYDSFIVHFNGIGDRLWLNAAGIFQIHGDIRAPIFYDSANTGYYVDPASASSAKFAQFVQIGDSSSYATNSGSWGARLNVTDNVHAKIEVGQDANGMLSHWYAHTGQSSIKFGTSSSHDVEFQRGGATQLYLNSGYAGANNQFRAPIFYDSNNTGYYVDPASTSYLSAVQAYSYQGNGNVAGTGNASYHPSGIYSTGTNWLYGTMYMNGNSQYMTGGSMYSTNEIVCDQNYGRGLNGVYNSYRYQHVWMMGTDYQLAANGTGTGNAYGLSYTHTNVGTGTNQSIAGLSHQLQGRHNGSLVWAAGLGIWTAYNITAYSDIAVKTNLEIIPDALAKVCQLNGYTYDRTDYKVDPLTGEMPETRQAGVVAQEVEKVLPEVVSGEEGNKAVAYGNMVALLIEAIKEQQTQIEAMAAEIKSLKEIKQ